MKKLPPLIIDDWRPCPSVMTGGKEYFYYNANKQLWVVWDSFKKKWILKDKHQKVLLETDCHKNGITAGNLL